MPLLLLLWSVCVISKQLSCLRARYHHALKLKGGLIVPITAVAWHGNSLREGLYGFNSGWPQTVFATFSNLHGTLMKKIHRVSSMVCWWEHVYETFLLLLLDFLLCQVLCFLRCLCLQHVKTLHSPHCRCSSGVIWKAFLKSQRLWPCLLHGQHSRVYEIRLWKSVLLGLLSLSVSTHKLMLIFQHQGRDWHTI